MFQLDNWFINGRRRYLRREMLLEDKNQSDQNQSDQNQSDQNQSDQHGAINHPVQDIKSNEDILQNNPPVVEVNVQTIKHNEQEQLGNQKEPTERKEINNR
jgi:SLT domain-containing protein